MSQRIAAFTVLFDRLTDLRDSHTSLQPKPWISATLRPDEKQQFDVKLYCLANCDTNKMHM